MCNESKQPSTTIELAPKIDYPTAVKTLLPAGSLTSHEKAKGDCGACDDTCVTVNSIKPTDPGQERTPE
jgi:hypothetical protein